MKSPSAETREGFFWSSSESDQSDAYRHTEQAEEQPPIVEFEILASDEEETAAEEISRAGNLECPEPGGNRTRSICFEEIRDPEQHKSETGTEDRQALPLRC